MGRRLVGYVPESVPVCLRWKERRHQLVRRLSSRRESDGRRFGRTCERKPESHNFTETFFAAEQNQKGEIAPTSSASESFLSDQEKILPLPLPLRETAAGDPNVRQSDATITVQRDKNATCQGTSGMLCVRQYLLCQ